MNRLQCLSPKAIVCFSLASLFCRNLYQCTQRRHSGTAQPHTLHAGALQVAPRPPSLTSLPASRADPCKARPTGGLRATAAGIKRRPCMGRARCYFSLRRRAVCSSFGEPQRGGRASGAVYKLSTLHRLGGRGERKPKAWSAGQRKNSRRLFVARAPRHTAPFHIPALRNEGNEHFGYAQCVTQQVKDRPTGGLEHFGKLSVSREHVDEGVSC
jgi:hypothetical protein